MARSTHVVTPRVKANPWTPPTARKYRTIAATRLTASETRIVRLACFHPSSIAVLRVRP